MATFRGCTGVIEVGVTPTVLGEVTAFDYTETAQELDTSSMDGTCASTSQAGTVKTTGTITMNWDHTDAGQDLIITGQEIDLEINPSGTAVGEPKFSGTALILTKGASSEVNGIISATFGYSINGLWVETPNS